MAVRKSLTNKIVIESNRKKLGKEWANIQSTPQRLVIKQVKDIADRVNNTDIHLLYGFSRYTSRMGIYSSF